MARPPAVPRRAAPSLLALGVFLAAALLPSVARGHGAGIPWIYVEADRVWPGETFHVLVLDVAPYVTVTLHAELDGARATLGEVATGPQGHGEADVSLPADFPHGYAQLRGVGDDGSEVDAPLPVGNVPAIDIPVGPQPPPAEAPVSPLADPSLWTLGVIVGGALLAVGWMALRRRQPAPLPAMGAGGASSGEGERARRPRKATRRRRAG